MVSEILPDEAQARTCDPLVNETVVAVIQAQQEDTRAQWGNRSPYLFTRPLKRARGQPLPFVRMTFANRLNRWALEKTSEIVMVVCIICNLISSDTR
jgi:hypothetical protein